MRGMLQAKAAARRSGIYAVVASFLKRSANFANFANFGLLAVSFLACSPVAKVAKIAPSPPGLAIWAPLSGFEIQTIQAVREQQTPDNLLRLALVLSGTRSQAEAEPLLARYRRFVLAVTPLLQRQKDAMSKGRVLLQQMHLRILGTQPKPFRSRYQLHQTRVDQTLTDGTFNCLSSAVLYGILALHFGFQVDGVELTNHVFLQLRHSSFSAPVEVEPTSYTGFARKHDRKYYEKQAQVWSRRMGLRPGTYEDYQNRKIRSFLDALCSLSNVQHTKAHVMSEPDRRRIREVAGYVCAAEVNQVNRIAVWTRVVHELVRRGQWKRVGQFFERVKVPLLDLQRRKVRKARLHHAITSVGLLRWQATFHLQQWDSAFAAFERSRPWLDSLTLQKHQLVQFAHDVLTWGMYALGRAKRTDLARLWLRRIQTWKPAWTPALTQRFWLTYGNQWFQEKQWDQAIQAFRTCMQGTPPSSRRSLCEQNLRAAIHNKNSGF